MKFQWIHTEVLMNFTWTYNEFTLKFIWTSYEVPMNSHRSSYELLMTFQWIHTEVHMNFIWSFYEFQWNFIWTLYEFHMKFPWSKWASRSSVRIMVRVRACGISSVILRNANKLLYNHYRSIYYIFAVSQNKSADACPYHFTTNFLEKRVKWCIPSTSSVALHTASPSLLLIFTV